MVPVLCFVPHYVAGISKYWLGEYNCRIALSPNAQRGSPIAMASGAPRRKGRGEEQCPRLGRTEVRAGRRAEGSARLGPAPLLVTPPPLLWLRVR